MSLRAWWWRMYHHHYCRGKGCVTGCLRFHSLGYEIVREEDMKLLSYEPGKLSVTQGPSSDRKRVADPLRALLIQFDSLLREVGWSCKGHLDNRGHLCSRMETSWGGVEGEIAHGNRHRLWRLIHFCSSPHSQLQGEMQVEKGYKHSLATRKLCFSVYVCDCVCIQNSEVNLECQPPRSCTFLEVVYVHGVQQLLG